MWMATAARGDARPTNSISVVHTKIFFQKNLPQSLDKSFAGITLNQGGRGREGKRVRVRVKVLRSQGE